MKKILLKATLLCIFNGTNTNLSTSTNFNTSKNSTNLPTSHQQQGTTPPYQIPPLEKLKKNRENLLQKYFVKNSFC